MIHEDVWKTLESESLAGEKVTARLALPETSRRLYAGLDANKLRHLLIPLDDTEKDCSDSQSRGLSVVTRDLVVQGKEPRKYIDITCHDETGYTIFDLIAKEIAENIERGEPNEVIMNIVTKWRRFWGQPVRDLLSREEIIGLFAEIWFLLHWLLQRADQLSAVAGWRGPFHSRHDFEWKGKSVEVKATMSSQGRTHRVHGLEQLVPPEDGTLMLFSLRLCEEQGAENSLPKLVALCQEKLKNNIEALSKFENALAIIGYSPIHNEEYSKLHFRVVDQKIYSVSEDFPKLTPSSFTSGIPQGVSVVEYTINLEGFDHLCVASHPDEIDLP